MINEIKWDKQQLKQLEFLSWFFDVVIDGDAKTIKFYIKDEGGKNGNE